LVLAFLASSAAARELRDCAVAHAPPAAVGEALDTFLKDSVDPDSHYGKQSANAPGAVLLVRGPDWTYFKAAGFADHDTGSALECGAPFQIGSATKMMTATILLQLEEDGLLSLDDRLADHLPEFAARIPFGDRMTLRHLATHTSGLFSYTDNAPDGSGGIMEGALTDPAMLSRGRTPTELVEFAIAHGAPYFEPGADGEWASSNTGYILLGMIIEKLLDQPLQEVFEQRIFDRVGMADTFLWNDVPKPEFGLPRAWFRAPFDIETTDWNLSQAWAAGAVISTAPDLAKFLEMLMSGGFFDDPETLTAMKTGVPVEFPMVRYGIGLAEKPDDAFGHGGQTMGFESDSAYVPSSRTALVYWTNSANSVAAVGAPVIFGAIAKASAP
jgi:D-alanyl-D-alanine carboxypeptidase